MTGDLVDLILRLKASLPRRWFGDDTSTLDLVLRGPARVLGQCHTMIQDVRRQVRLHLADGHHLDTLASDYLGRRAVRRSREDDSSFRARVMKELLRVRATRAAVVEALQDITGREPIVFEPAMPRDTGGYGAASSARPYGMGYGVAGGWGSLQHANQCFVTAFRPVGIGSAPGMGWGSGGYNSGYNAYADQSVLQGRVSDGDIHAALRNVLPAGTTGWLRISS